MPVETKQAPADHHQILDMASGRQRRILMVVANPSFAPALGWKIGFWAAELMHPYFEFSQAGYEVTIASPDGGAVEMDTLSDPRDPSEWSASDTLSMGFINSPDLIAKLDDTAKLSALALDKFDAIVVCGGFSPMFTFRDNADLKRAITTFYESKRITAVFCHGVAALIDAQLSDGSYLIAGKTMTGFSNVEEQFSDDYVGQQVMPWRLEDAAKSRGANYVMGGKFKSFAVRDGVLITGQQQYSARRVAQMVIDALGA